MGSPAENDGIHALATLENLEVLEIMAQGEIDEGIRHLAARGVLSEVKLEGTVWIGPLSVSYWRTAHS